MKSLLDQLDPNNESKLSEPDLDEQKVSEPTKNDLPSNPLVIPIIEVDLLPEGTKPDFPSIMGRPTIFTQELADKICEQIAEGISLRTICRDDSMPNTSTIFRWLRIKEDFCNQYRHARVASADAMAEDILDIADNSTNDYMTIQRGKFEMTIPDREVLLRSKLRVDARIWLMSKLQPKKYGDKVDHTTNGKDLPVPLLNVLHVHNHDGDPQNSGNEEKN